MWKLPILRKLSIELLLFVLALVWALFLAVKLQSTADQGLSRWQADAQWVDNPKGEFNTELRALWCERSMADVKAMFGNEAVSQCPWRLQALSIWDVIAHQPLATTKDALIVSETEMVHQLSAWQTVFEADLAWLQQSPLASEKTVAAATKRLQQWKTWQASRISSNALHAPGNNGFAVWQTALALEGKGVSDGAALVRQRQVLFQSAIKGKQLFHIVSELPACIFLHWLVTYVGLLLVRSRISVLSKQVVPVATPDFNVSIAVGWWLFTATGWLLILDQSLNFHDRLRFLALEQWWTWCFAVLVLLLGIVLSRFINSRVAKLNAFVWLQSRNSISLFRHVAPGFTLVAAFVLLNRFAQLPSYITGELIKLLFLFLLAGWSLWRMPLAAQLWHEGYALAASRLLMGLGVLLLITAVLSGVTADKGTWLVIAICSVILLASVMGWTTGFVLLMVGFLLIFLLGEQMEVVGDRLQAWRNAFTADRDDMSRLLWFQTEAGQRLWGWGVGQTPWCAGERLDQCWGLPLQLQSDYTMTALIGWFGLWGAWAFVIFYSMYVFVWISVAAKRSNSELQPCKLFSPAGVIQALGTQLFFIAGLLVLIQSWITVAGNLSWIPLTGITWPLISYGKTSLWLFSAVIGVWGIRKTYA